MECVSQYAYLVQHPNAVLRFCPRITTLSRCHYQFYQITPTTEMYPTHRDRLS